MLLTTISMCWVNSDLHFTCLLFVDRIKIVPLLTAAGFEDKAFLQSVGFNTRQSSYEEAYALPYGYSSLPAPDVL